MLEIGSSLREARRRRGLELADVEKAIRIRKQQLEALELERFDLLPPDPYRRAFLREYADFLGLDGDIYTSEYERRSAPPEPSTVALPPPRYVRATRMPRRRALGVGGAIAMAALLAIGARELGFSAGSNPVASTTAPPKTTLARRPPARPQAAGGQTRAVARPVLALTTTRGRCWLWVRIGSSTGPTIFKQTLESGHTLRLGLRRPLWIRLGAPWNVDATLGRRVITRTLPSAIGDVVASAVGLRPAP